jgi:TRAP-type C4-dicarboxylate transport system permease small subunit
MEAIKTQIFKVVRWLDMVSAAAIVAMMALTCADVVLRWFRRPIKGTYELVSFLGAIAVSFAVAHTLAQKGHVAVNLLVRLLPNRVQGVIESIIALLSGVLFAVIGWQCWRYGLGSQMAGEVSLTLQLPLYPVIYGVAIGIGAVCLVCLVDLANAIAKVRGA